MAHLEAVQLAKSYDSKPVVIDVSIEVSSGEIIGLLGPNGAGKTTCFYMIAGLIKADRGAIKIDGEDIMGLSMDMRAKRGLGYLPQEASVFRKLTVEDNILAILQTRKDLSKDQRIDKLNSLIDEFQIGHIRDRKGMQLSGGERRRVEIARALATDPTFILLDEPFAGVDPISVNETKSILVQLRDRGIGVLITDHNVRETLDICERAYIVGEGHIIARGSSNDILENSRVRSIYLGEDFRL